MTYNESVEPTDDWLISMGFTPEDEELLNALGNFACHVFDRPGRNNYLKIVGEHAVHGPISIHIQRDEGLAPHDVVDALRKQLLENGIEPKY